MSSRLERLWQQFRCPLHSYDLLRDVYLIPVAGSMIDRVGVWSEPVQVRVVQRPGPFGTDLEMEIRIIRDYERIVISSEIDRAIDRMLEEGT